MKLAEEDDHMGGDTMPVQATGQHDPEQMPQQGADMSIGQKIQQGDDAGMTAAADQQDEVQQTVQA